MRKSFAVQALGEAVSSEALAKEGKTCSKKFCSA